MKYEILLISVGIVVGISVKASMGTSVMVPIIFVCSVLLVLILGYRHE